MRSSCSFFHDKRMKVFSHKNIREEFQKITACLRLRIERAYPSEKIADIADCSYGLVKKVISDYGRAGLAGILRGTFGGNRRNFSLSEEEKLLEPFLKRAESGQILVVADIQKAYEEALGRNVPPSTVYRMLDRHKWRKVMPRPKHPKAKPEEQEAYKKIAGKIDELVNISNKPLRAMFQDEAGFGRINKPKRCWCPKGCRPAVPCQHIREYTYAYSAVSPHDGAMVSLILPKTNSVCMSIFLEEVSRRFPDEYIL